LVRKMNPPLPAWESAIEVVLTEQGIAALRK
jgi:hypothetical protein